MSQFSIFQNLEEISFFLEYLKECENLNLTEIVCELKKVTDKRPNPKDINTVAHSTKEIIWDKFNDALCHLVYCHNESFSFPDAIKQHIIISSLYTCKELQSKQIDARNYLLNIFATTKNDDTYISEENAYRFLLKSLGNWEKSILNISTQTINGGGRRKISDFQPLFLYGYRANKDTNKLVYPSIKFTKKENRHNEYRKFWRFLTKLDNISNHLIDYSEKNIGVEHILYYYKHERAYGIDLLKEILLQMHFQNGELLSKISHFVQQKNVSSWDFSMIPSLLINDFAERNNNLHSNISLDDVISFLPKNYPTSKRKEKYSQDETKYILDLYDASGKWASAFDNNVYDINYIIKLQQFPNVFTRNALVSILNGEHPYYIDTLLYKIIPLSEFIFFSLINMIWNPSLSTAGLKVIDDALSLYINVKMENLLDTSDNLTQNNVWLQPLLRIKEKNPSDSTQNISLLYLYTNLLDNYSIFEKQSAQLVEKQRITLDNYFKERYRTSWWDYNHQSKIRNLWHKN